MIELKRLRYLASNASLKGLRLALLVFVLMTSLSALAAQAQSSPDDAAPVARKAFSKSEIVDLMKLGTPESLLIRKIRSAGIDFVVTQDDLDDFAHLGTSKALLAVIREASDRFEARIGPKLSPKTNRVPNPEDNLSRTGGNVVGNPSEVQLPPGVPSARGIVETAFSLRYQDIEIGDGQEGEPGKVWHLKYTGWRASDGVKFDSWEDHKPSGGEPQPLAIPQGIGRVIPGFDYGLTGMRIGGKRRLFIPWQMAYGTRSIPDRPDHPGIPAKSDLIFDVELVGVTDAPMPTNLSSATPSGAAFGSGGIPTQSGVTDQIDAVVRSGRYAALPPAQAISSGGAGQPELFIENRTSYQLSVLFAGPVEQSISITPGSTQSIVMPPGTYQVLGRVTASDVLPFYGNQDFASGTEYKESFYVQ